MTVLAELNPKHGAASIYRTRDLVSPAMMPQLMQGNLLTTNWHIFEPKSTQSGSRVVKSGKRQLIRDTVIISNQTARIRGKRYITESELQRQETLDLITVKSRKTDKEGNLQSAEIEEEKYIETDAAVVRRVLQKDLGSRSNILVFNDEAHHAYRLQDDNSNEQDDALFDEEELDDYYHKEATVWVDGLDRIHKLRNINMCIDFSATPYFLSRAGKNTNRMFPWTVSSFDLQDAIESGLVKIPQLAVRDSSGDDVPVYFNIWQWVLNKLTSTERGGKRIGAKPEAIIKHAHAPIEMMCGEWSNLRKSTENSDDPRPPVFIIVCKTKNLAKLIYDWLAEGKQPNDSIPLATQKDLRNTPEKQNTILVYSDVQKDIDSGGSTSSKKEEVDWMRFTLYTIGKTAWPSNDQGHAQYPEGFEALATKRKHGLHPPGRDVRCVVSVGMLTEGWDCNTVTHIIGLRPFMSQLLCEQVVGRGLRRISYELGEDGLMQEEVANILGIPMSAFTVKATGHRRKQ